MGTHWGNIRLYRGHMGNMETKMDTTVWGLGFREDSLSGIQLDHGSCLAICLPLPQPDEKLPYPDLAGSSQVTKEWIPTAIYSSSSYQASRMFLRLLNPKPYSSLHVPFQFLVL